MRFPIPKTVYTKNEQSFGRNGTEPAVFGDIVDSTFEAIIFYYAQIGLRKNFYNEAQHNMKRGDNGIRQISKTILKTHTTLHA